MVLCQKDANGIANSEDPDQTAPLGAVRSGSALFAQTYLYEILGSLRYLYIFIKEDFFLVLYKVLCFEPVKAYISTLE